MLRKFLPLLFLLAVPAVAQQGGFTGSGGSSTPPTGTGFVHVTAGVQDAAATTAAATLTAIGAAPSASPALTGIPTAPTPAVTVSNTQLATAAYVRAVVLKGTITATTATTASATITGIATTSSCTFSPSNLAAGADVVTDHPFISVTANTVTLTFATAPAATGDTFSLTCVQ